MYPVSINERVENIRGDEQGINSFVEEYKPFIASCVEKVTGRYVRYGEDDELSIALMAFVEAINSYDNRKGSFLSFSQNVIKRRLIDYFRKEKKHSSTVSLNECYGDDEDQEIDLSTNESIEKFSKEEISEYRRLEIEDLKMELRKWDISISDLVESSPKHDKTRRLYAGIAKYIVSRPELISIIMNKKYLPVADIEKDMGIPRKKIERARKYIIAVVVIILGDYQYIRNFIEWG